MRTSMAMQNACSNIGTRGTKAISMLPARPTARRRTAFPGHPQAPITAARVSAAALVDSPTASSGSQAMGASAAASVVQPSYDWHNHWYPVAFTECIDKENPYRFMLLGEALVIWWDKQQQAWNVVKDQCPHRLVPLSEGRVNKQGELECGYHGWTFASDGSCTSIPQGGDHTMPRACVTAYPHAVRQGLLFVKPKPLPNSLLAGKAAYEAALAAADESTIPTVPELDEPGWLSGDTFRIIPYDWVTLVTNVLDASHVPFTHHKSISNRNKIGDFAMRLEGSVTPDGFTGIWPTGPRAGALGQQRGIWKPPTLVMSQIDSAKTTGTESAVVVYATPMAPGQVLLINRNLIKFHKSQVPSRLFSLVPKAFMHLGTQVALEDDQIFLHYGEEDYARARAAGKTAAQAYVNASGADTYVAAFLRWVDKFGGGGPFGPFDEQYLQRMAPRLSRERLLDRWWGHTSHCAQCQATLRRLQAARRALATASGLAGWAAVFAGAVGVALAGFGVSAGGLPAGGAAAAAAVGNGGSLASQAASLLLTAGQWVAGVGGGTAATAAGPQAALLRGLVYVVSAAALHAANSYLARVEGLFHAGQYPPPRNLDKD